MNAPTEIEILTDGALTMSPSLITQSVPDASYECTYLAAAGETVELLNSSSLLPPAMVVDGEEVKPSYTYVFDTDGIHTVSFPFSSLFLGDMLSFSLCTRLTSITIPEGVTGLANSCFSGCSGLTSVTLPSTLKGISDYAFGDCIGLNSVTIPENVKSIERAAFYGCTGLTSISIPEGVTNISDGAFEYCTKLTSVSLPLSLTNLTYGAFKLCIYEA